MSALAEQYPPFRAAAVQASSVWLDREASTEKACALIEEAGRSGADVVALPESFIPGFPYWVFVKPLSETGRWHARLHDQAVEIPGPTIEALAGAAARAAVYAVVGVTERDRGSIGTLYNTNVVLSPEGELAGKHRKLVPTWGERAVWTGGDGSTLSVFPTRFGPLGTLNCGENLCISGVLGPDGEWLTRPLQDEPGIVYADCSIDPVVFGRLFHDLTGHYNRFDVLRLEIDRRPAAAVHVAGS